VLKIKNLSKNYYVDNKPVTVLKNLNIEFKEKEFVSILGPSGCGKTTLLNIIGGLDRYDEGDLIIDNISTKKYKDDNWDSYRNHRIGFVFQSYNLINHLSVLENVELALTLSGVSKALRRKKASDILKKVGLKDHLTKKPTQLSGGQMQRVAIARALINDPNIILADEPTGALDSQTSVEILKILKDISKDKLIIMVTHNQKLAEEYSNRIISLLDGKITGDSNPVKNDHSKIIEKKDKKTAMSFFTALALSFKNLLTKKTRTLLTAFAGSIGIVGIALSLSLKNGFDIYLDSIENDNFSIVPLNIEKTFVDISVARNANKPKPIKDGVGGYEYKPNVKTNNLENEAFTNLIENELKEASESIITFHDYKSMFVSKVGEKLIVRYNNPFSNIAQPDLNSKTIFIRQPNVAKSFSDEKLITLASSKSDSKYQAYLFINNDGRVQNSVLEFLGLPEDRKIEYNEILGKKFKVYPKEKFDNFDENGNFKGTLNDYDNNDDGKIEVEITSILYSSSKFITLTPGIYYNDEVKNHIMDNSDKNVLLRYSIYPKDLENKKEIKKILNNFNEDENRKNEDIISYADDIETIVGFINNLTDTVSIVLIVFSAVSLFVSSVMIGIITYTSVLERTKEIGILRSVGARKKDISRVFNAEGIMLGFSAGFLGILFTMGINPLINIALKDTVEYYGIAKLNLLHALGLILISVLLTLIAGIIPARIAAKKDPVVALRSE